MTKRRCLLPNVLKVVLVCCALSYASATSLAQDVVYDWQNSKLISYPTRVNRPQRVNIIIKNINDILYTYKTTVTITPVPPNDWGLIGVVFGLGVQPGERSACSDAIESAKADMKVIVEKDYLPMKIVRDNKPTPPSVSLDNTLKAWGEIQGNVVNLRQKAGAVFTACDRQAAEDFRKDYDPLNRTLQDVEYRVSSFSHEARDTVMLGPDNNYKVTVEEFFNGKKTDGGQRVFEFSPASGTLTLSIGPLFSRIQDRTYEARKFPGSDTNVLVVQGNSRLRPELVALLNYSLPRVDGDTFGLTLSAGPAVRLGSKADIATLGFFAGLSGHLYHRFYITPGIHFGQFADFPAGFRNGSSVPANFGELNPVKRYTARFAFTVSFRTVNFSSLAPAKPPAVSGGDSSKK